MPNLHIHRDHTLGLAKARKVAWAWAEQAENEFGMECTYEEGDVEDEVCFKRSGVTGTLKVNKASFELDAQLGFLLGAFKDKIEAEIVKNLDQLLAAPVKDAQAATKKKKSRLKAPLAISSATGSGRRTAASRRRCWCP